MNDAGEDADLWLNLKSRLLKGLVETLSSKWRYRPNLDIPKAQAALEWQRVLLGNEREVDRLAVAWIDSGQIETQDSELSYFLAARLFVSHYLVSKFTYVKHGEWTALLPIPSNDQNQVLRMFLLEWWYGVGQFMAFDFMYGGAMEI